eukprot:m.130158 g.130158  ORF g.130158 m.130158 type:complete len:222 (-) comp14595_c0_seq8:1127-1792(-)
MADPGQLTRSKPKKQIIPRGPGHRNVVQKEGGRLQVLPPESPMLTPDKSSADDLKMMRAEIKVKELDALLAETERVEKEVKQRSSVPNKTSKGSTSSTQRKKKNSRSEKALSKPIKANTFGSEPSPSSSSVFFTEIPQDLVTSTEATSNELQDTQLSIEEQERIARILEKDEDEEESENPYTLSRQQEEKLLEIEKRLESFDNGLEEHTIDQNRGNKITLS